MSVSPPPVPKRIPRNEMFVGLNFMPPTGCSKISIMLSSLGVSICSAGCTPAKVVFGDSLSVFETAVSFEPRVIVVAAKSPCGFCIPFASKEPSHGHVTVPVPLPDGPLTFVKRGVRTTVEANA